MEISRTVRILNRSFKIYITQVLDFWKLYEGDLVYLEDSDEMIVDETKCPKITHEVYPVLFKGIIKALLNFMIETPEKKLNPKDIPYNEFIQDAICEVCIEDYESLEHFNIVVEEELKVSEEIRFEQTSHGKIDIFRGVKQIGHIFTPSGSGGDIINSIQVCGFSDAYDLWGCGVYKGNKDIQLLFDNKTLEGKYSEDLTDCCRCFHTPCQCENKTSRMPSDNDFDAIEDLDEPSNPFNVKRQQDLKDRLEYVKNA